VTAIGRHVEPLHADEGCVPDELALLRRIDREPPDFGEVVLLVVGPGVDPVAAVSRVPPQGHGKAVSELPDA
jgi:hypothetical protein